MQSSRENLPNFSDREQATVEETSEDLELLTILRNAAQSGSHSLDSIVDAVADAARALSGADGTALGLETRGAIICRARSGDIAPPLGSPISAESGISGECLRSLKILVCHDAMTDPRVDADVCRSLGIRSIAAVPVRGATRAAGILEAFSARATAFDGDALIALQELAEIAEAAYRREASSHIVVKPSQSMAKPLAAAAHAIPAASPSLAAEDILDDLSQAYKGRVKWVALAAVVLLVIVGVAWWAWHTPADESANNSPEVRAVSPEPAASQQVREVVPKPGPGVPTPHPEHTKTGIMQNAAEVTPIDLRPDQMAAASGAPDTLEVKIPKAAARETSPAPEPPTVDFAPSSNPSALTQLTSVQPQMPTAAPRISQGVVEATLIHRVEPRYPEQARNLRLQGKVTLSATIATDGSVREISVVGGQPILAEAAKVAVRQWRYRPASLNGTPIAVQKDVIVMFAQP